MKRGREGKTYRSTKHPRITNDTRIYATRSREAAKQGKREERKHNNG